MRTIMLIFILTASFKGVYAQNDLVLKISPPIDFNSGVLAPDSSYLLFGDKSRNQDFKIYFEKMVKEKKDVVVPYSIYNMPVVQPREYIWNMPVVVPDSTINYTIRIIGAENADPKVLSKSLGSE